MITEFVSIWLVGGVNWPASGSAFNPSITLLSRLLSLLIHCFSRVFFCVFNWFFFFPQWKDLGQGRMCSWQKVRSVAFAWSPVKSSWASRSFWSWKLPWKSVVSSTLTQYKHYRLFCVFIFKEITKKAMWCLTWSSTAPCRWCPWPILWFAPALWIWRLPPRE